MKYYVYQLIDPILNKPFYIGKGTKNRAWMHNKFKDRNNNLHKDNYIRQLHKKGVEPIVDIVHYFDTENEAYDYEEILTESIGLENLTNITLGSRPPSRVGWKPTLETLEKRSKGLKGIPRTEEWCKNLSLAKQGKNNPMYGRKNPCSEERQLAIIRTKNLPNYDLYKSAIELMNTGLSADTVSFQLGISRGVCFKLKNRSHLFFKAFPELV
jgi:hypothetical protein